MCLNPKLLKKSGKYKEANYRGAAGDKYSIEVYTDCGACEQCIAKRANAWVVRNYFEALNKINQKKCFVTLTYKKQPFFIVYKDIQDWMKRFRFELNKEYHKAQKYAKKTYSPRVYELWQKVHGKEYIKVRFFGACEYGSRRGRPHAHCIIYGWEDEKAIPIEFNKKLNVIYHSDIIEKTWGLGRTSYQPYGDHEKNYLSLYCTPQETFKKAYKLSRDKLKQINQWIKEKYDYLPPRQRANLMAELQQAEIELQDERKKYLLIKERNFWSTAIGWEEFFEEYSQEKIHTFEAYINDMRLVVPSSWLKKLANKYGDIEAAEELFAREQNQYRNATEDEERTKNRLKVRMKRKKEILEWQEGRKNGEIDVF